jgi:hypothetical protein
LPIEDNSGFRTIQLRKNREAVNSWKISTVDSSPSARAAMLLSQIPNNQDGTTQYPDAISQSCD